MRPSMYIGDVGTEACTIWYMRLSITLLMKLWQDIVNNITVIINEDNSITTEDDGRGIPVDLHKKEGVSALKL